MLGRGTQGILIVSVTFCLFKSSKPNMIKNVKVDKALETTQKIPLESL